MIYGITFPCSALLLLNGLYISHILDQDSEPYL